MIRLVLWIFALLVVAFPAGTSHASARTLQGNEMTEAVFNSILSKIDRVYQPIAQQRGVRLYLSGTWNSEAINAGSNAWGPANLFVTVEGGLARHPLITADALTLVLCHELGHVFGGFPFKRLFTAAEGEADYYATQVCAPTIWDDEHVLNAESLLLVPSEAKDLCDTHWSDHARRSVCYRSMVAAKSIGQFLKRRVSSEKQTLDFSGSDKSKVSETILEGYPNPACRFDTLVAGSLCAIPFDHSSVQKSYSDLENSSCTDLTASPSAHRPRCWFKPQDW